MIEFDHVARNYGSRAAVADLTLRIAPGELFAFLGPNGAGKTTTIKMLVGLLRPTSGTIRLCGYDVARQSELAKRCLGYVPDEPFLYDKLSGREFLEFVAQMHGIERRRVQRFIERQIADFSLGEFIDDLTESYSLGMKQRLAFAAALVHEPAVLVIDEPMIGLDPRTARVVKDLLRSKADQGTAIFMSTHLLSVAEEIADRIAIVDHGHLKYLGTRGEVAGQLAAADTTLEQFYLNLTAPPAAAPADRASLAAAPVEANSAEPPA